MHSQKLKRKPNHNSDTLTQSVSVSFEAIGTSWKIDVPVLQPSTQQALLTEIKERILEFDSTYSRFQPHSWVTTISQKAGTYRLPHDAKYMLDVYKKLYDLSNGAFTPLVGNLLEQAGYDRKYTLKPSQLHTPYKFDEVISYTSSHIELRQPVLLDFGASGKGYLIDLLAQIIEKHNIDSYCIDASGDIFYKDEPKRELRIGLEHPDKPNQIIGITTILDESICASAGNRRSWDEFHHIINPHTLSSPREILSTWVKAKDAIVADAIATCLFLTEPEKLQKEFQFNYLVLLADYTIKKSDQFHAELYYN